MARKRYGEDDILRLIREVEVHCSIGVAASADTNPLQATFYGSFLHTEYIPNALFFFSEIERDDSFELRKAMRNHEIETIVLSSPGGSFGKHTEMGIDGYSKCTA